MNLPQDRRDLLKRYGLALVLAGLALSLRGVLPFKEGTSIYQLPLAAVILSAWYGGRGPGWLASLICVAGASYLFVPPVHSFSTAPDHVLPLSIFAALCLLLTEFGTGRRRVEHGLRVSEERFRTLVQFSFDVYWETDGKHRFTHQEFSERLTDAPARGAEIGKTRWEIPYLEPDEETWRKHRETMDAHLPFRDFELARPTPAGDKRFVSVSGMPVFDSAGRFVGYRGVGRHITEQKRAEAELRARQEMLDLAQAAARAVAFDWRIGARENENRWSPELEALYGLEPGTFDRTYKGWKKLVHPDDWPAVKLALERAHKSGDVAAEYRVIHKDGTVHWLRAKGRMLFDAEGRPERMVGFMLDVTAWRYAEEELRASEARFRTFVDRATDAFFLMDEELRVVDVNRQACDSMGWSREELIGMHPSEFDVALDEPSIQRLAQRASGGEIVTFETRHRRKGGTVFPVEVRAGTFRQGEKLFYLSLARDISERKHAEESLRQSEAYLTEAQRLSHTGSWAFDVASNRYIYTSEESDRLFGIDPQGEKPTREVIFERIHPEDRSSWKRNLEKSLREKVDTTDQYRVVLPDGTVRHIRTIRHPVVNSAGEVVKLVGTSIDITERKRAEEELRAKDDALQTVRTELARVSRLTTLGEMTTSIAHEVSQPIGAMVASAGACARWLAADPPAFAEAQNALDNIAADGKRAREVIGRIRALTKRQAPRKDLLDINHKIVEVLALTEHELRSHDIVLRTQLDKGVPRIAGDRVQLQQVILNLIVNAMDAMSGIDDRARELTIVSGRDDTNTVTVEVRDSGTGLDAQSAERLFEAFYTTKVEGIGIGLSISRSIVEAHGGRLWAAPNEPHGAVFLFSLPVAHEAGS